VRHRHPCGGARPRRRRARGPRIAVKRRVAHMPAATGAGR
jgi:hypothetical protein